VSITVREPQPLAWEFVVVPALVTIALLFAVLLLTRRRSARPKDPSQRASLLPPDTGLRKSLVPHRTIRRFELFDFSGRVMDPIEERPVCDAVIEVTGSTSAPLAVSNSDGTFEVGPLERGTYEISISAAGYVPETFSVKMPHDGRYRNVTVSIIQIRHRAFEIYKAVARPLLPRQALWGKWTPREVAVHSVKTHPWLSDDIAEITSFFEDIYYSSAIGEPDDLARIRQLASRLKWTDRDRMETKPSDG
jgi:hypothetical protein